MIRNRTLTTLIVVTFLGLVAAQGMMEGQNQAPGKSGMGQSTMGHGMMGHDMMSHGTMGHGMMSHGTMGHGTMSHDMTSHDMRDSMMGSMMGGMGMMQTLPASATPLSDDELLVRLQAAATDFGPDARLADAMPFSNHTYAQIVDGDGNGLAEVLVDRYTGVVMPEPGPNMMWNPSGMMGMSTTVGKRFDEAETQGLAEEFLASFLPGADILSAQNFPGYVTFDYGRNGRVEGMLSVNTSLGLVWQHSWHGLFLGEAHD